MANNFPEAALVHALTQTEGWKILAREFKNRYDTRFQKLRTCTRDSYFYKTQGYLDAIEEIFNLVNQKMVDVEEGE